MGGCAIGYHPQQTPLGFSSRINRLEVFGYKQYREILEQFNQEQNGHIVKGASEEPWARVSMRIFIITMFSVYVYIPAVIHAHRSKEFRES